jgi:hypothetical protein
VRKRLKSAVSSDIHQLQRIVERTGKQCVAI